MKSANWFAYAVLATGLTLNSVVPMNVMAVENDSVIVPTSITPSVSVIHLKKGESKKIDITFSQGTTDTALTWSTWDEDLIKVYEDGTIEAIEDEGWTCVNVYSTNNPSVFAQIEVYVGSEDTPEYPTEFSLDTDIRTFLVQDQTGSVWTNGFTECKNKEVTYSSSNNQVATVDQSGNIKAVGAGRVTITATSVGKNDDMEKPAFASISFDVYGKDEQSGYQYSINESGVTLEKYIGTDSEVTIPSTINGKKVTHIGQNAFGYAENAEKIKKVIIPDTVVSIDDYAFNWCKNLESVLIPDGVQNIGKRSFCNTALKYIVIPNSVKTIGSEAFSDCKDLKEICIPSSITSIGANAFNGSGIQKISLPDYISYIGSNAFFGIDKIIVNKDSQTQITLKQLGISYVINHAPEIICDNIQIKKGTKFDALKDVIAKDAEDGDLSGKIQIDENNYKDEVGQYTVVYSVQDLNGLKATKKRQICVIDNVKQKIQTSKMNKSVNTAVNQDALIFGIGILVSCIGYICIRKKDN